MWKLSSIYYVADKYFKNNLAYTSVNQISDPLLSLSGWIFILHFSTIWTTTMATTHLHPKCIMCRKELLRNKDESNCKNAKNCILFSFWANISS